MLFDPWRVYLFLFCFAFNLRQYEEIIVKKKYEEEEEA